MKRGEICWTLMNEPRGLDYQRPVVIVAVVTSNLRLADAPGNFKIIRKHSNLNKDSVVNVSQLITLDKLFLTEQIGKLNSKYISFLNEGVRLVLGV